jgi:hypothetical protein
LQSQLCWMEVSPIKNLSCYLKINLKTKRAWDMAMVVESQGLEFKSQYHKKVCVCVCVCVCVYIYIYIYIYIYCKGTEKKIGRLSVEHGARDSTYPVASGCRRVLLSGLLCWGQQVRRRPLHCRSGRCLQHHSHRHGWWGCWCCWVRESHCPQWKLVDSKRIAPVSENHFSSLVLKLCCLG